MPGYLTMPKQKTKKDIHYRIHIEIIVEAMRVGNLSKEIGRRLKVRTKT